LRRPQPLLRLISFYVKGDKLSDEFGKSVPRDKYWATCDTAELLGILVKKQKDFENFLLKSGRLMRWRMAWETYMASELRMAVIYGGGRGQFKILQSNIFRSIVTGLISVICNQRPSFEPQVINDDSKSLAQDEIAKSILDYYLKVGRLEDCYKKATLYGLLMTEGWLYEYWDATMGPVVDVLPGNVPKHEGEAKFKVMPPMDVCRDYTRIDMQNDWFIIREYLNKWDIIAARPDLLDKLQGLYIPQEMQRYRFGHMIDGSNSDKDLIPVYTLLHAKTKSCPNGRIVQFVDDETWILDTALPYDEIPLYPFTPDEEPEANFGATVMSSLIPLQRSYNMGMSVILTNQATFGVQNIAVDDSTQVKPEQVLDGVNLIRTNLSKGVPVALELCKTPPEIFQQLDRIEAQMEKLSGLPAILRGAPPTGITSGTAMAYLQAQALVFNSPIQQSYISLLERSATGLLNILKTFVDTKRVATIVGKSKASYSREFDGTDLEGISRIVVSAGNPAVKTEAGKIQTAQDFLQKGLVTTPQEYFEVVETGDLETMTEATEKELILIRRENETLMAGQPVVMAPGDNHPLHIREHQAVIMDASLRLQPNNPVLAAVLVHQQNHLAAMTPGGPQSADPRLLAILGIPPFPAPVPQQLPGTNVAAPVQNAPPAAHGVPSGAPPAPSAPPGNVPQAKPHAPVLPKATPGMVQNASAGTQIPNGQPHMAGTH
jgi:hypothetical protein